MAVTPRPERLPPSTFRLPVERIRDGYYSDAYFKYTKELLEHEARDPRVTMQVFQRKESILGGIDEAIAILRQCSGRRRPDGGWEDGWEELEVRALREGDAIADLPGLSRGKREYLRDVGDHLAQVTGELYRQADDLSALTSTYFNANANRLNRMAARLTVLATFFLIWTLVTSFFGQNFGWLVDHIDSLEAFVIYETIGLVIPTVVAAVYFWRRRREWL